jgi:hypothetical protein
MLTYTYLTSIPISSLLVRMYPGGGSKLPRLTKIEPITQSPKLTSQANKPAPPSPPKTQNDNSVVDNDKKNQVSLDTDLKILPSVTEQIKNTHIEPGLYTPLSWINKYKDKKDSSLDESDTSSVNLLNTLKEQGLLEYKQQNPKLSQQGHDINRALQPKLVLKDEKSEDTSDSSNRNVSSNYDILSSSKFKKTC